MIERKVARSPAKHDEQHRRPLAWLRPTAVTLTGGLAVAAMTATALSLFLDLDATIMVLIWNLAVAAVIVGIGYVLGLRAPTLDLSRR
ncbi:MAG: hypothetical protein M3Z31_03865 [Pseudomonadota bacterium]|nr:hypothetical protein [Pseudomonadota bacterium]